MHLRSVQIQGFKTFARKTELLFEPGITAVVGPNGSGKSNLVDAIRWVLGERSARELRGSKMEEVVYSGGSRRQASGMAEVRVLIDNADGRLPVPFQEVEVLRRGYRSGESEFWLNGSRCRLRDIEELFASTGLTQQGYSVVAQDDVDHIIQTSAGERRALIEEAAGVRGMRSKRDDALARIRESDITVLRLNDLAGELGPRVQELRHQAETARLENDLSARLGMLRGSLLRGEWLAARQKVKKGHARLATLVATADQAGVEAEAAAAEYAGQREHLARAHDARLARERALGTLRLAATEASANLQLLAERRDSAERAVKEAEALLAAATSRQVLLQAELAAATEDVNALASPAGTGGPDPGLQAALDELSRLRLKREEADNLVAELRQKAATDAAAATELEQRRQGAEAAGRDLDRELVRAEEELRVEQTTGSEVQPFEAAAQAAADVLEAALAAEGQAHGEVEARRLHERAAGSLVQRLEERATALRSLAAPGDLPAPSATRLVQLLEQGPVRAAAVAAGLAPTTIDQWLSEGRVEEHAVAHALEKCRVEGENAVIAEAEAVAALAAAQGAEEVARAAVEQARQEHLAAEAALSAAGAQDRSRVERAEAAVQRAGRMRQLVAERGQDLERLAARLLTVRQEAAETAARVAEAEPRLQLAVEAEVAAADVVTELQRQADHQEAQRAALVARAAALEARRNRATAQVAAQDAEVDRCRGRITQVAANLVQLEAARAEAERRHAAAVASLAVAAPEPTSEDVDALTAKVLLQEKANMELQLGLAHHQDALATARAVVAEDEAALAELSGRMGAAGEPDPADGELDWEKTQREIARLERQVLQLGPVNPLAVDEYERDHQRLAAIDAQRDDLVRAREGLVKLADELSREIDRRFEAVFGAVAYNFQETFARLFVDGRATLKLDDPEAEEPGVEILAQPAGKRMRGIRLLSGGERALTALAFILALEKVNPSPFYIFDEVDAPLDDANIKRFNAMLLSMAAENQFILITHNHQTMTSAQALYGVTLEDSGVSRVVSVRLREGQVVALPVASGN